MAGFAGTVGGIDLQESTSGALGRVLIVRILLEPDPPSEVRLTRSDVEFLRAELDAWLETT